MLPPRPLYPINESPSPRTSSSFSSFDDRDTMTEALAALRPMSPVPPGPPSLPSPYTFLAIPPSSPASPTESSDPTSSRESSVHSHLQPPLGASVISIGTTAESGPPPSPAPGFARKTPLTISRLFSGSRLKRKSRSPTPTSPNASAITSAGASASASTSTTAFTSASSIPSLRLSDSVSQRTAVEEPESASPPSSPVSRSSATPLGGLKLLAPRPTDFRGVPLTPARARAQAKRHSLDVVPQRPSSQESDREANRPLAVHAFSPPTPSTPRPHKSAPPSPTRPRSSVDLPRRASSPTPIARPSSPLRLGRGFNIFSSMFESRNGGQLPAIPSRPSSADTMDEFVSAAPIQHAIRNSGTFGIVDDGSEIFSLVGYEHLQRRRTSSGSIIEVTHVRRSLYAENPDPEDPEEVLTGEDEGQAAQGQGTRSGPSPAPTFGWRSPALVTPDVERGFRERGLGLHVQDSVVVHHRHGHPHAPFPPIATTSNGHSNGHANGHAEPNGTTSHGHSVTSVNASSALRTASLIMAAHAEALHGNAGAAGPAEDSLRRMAAESAQFSVVLEAMANSADFEHTFEPTSTSVHDVHDDLDPRPPRSRWSGLSAATVRANCDGHDEPPSLTTPPPPPLPPLPTELRSWAELRSAQGAWSAASSELRTILAARPDAGAARHDPHRMDAAHAQQQHLPLQLCPPTPVTEESEDVPPPIPPRSASTSPPHRFPSTPMPPRRSASTREARARSSTVSTPTQTQARRSSVAPTSRGGYGGINGDGNHLSLPRSRRYQSFSSSRSGDDYASEPWQRGGVGARVTRSISTRMRRLSRVVRSDEHEEDEERQLGWFRVTWGTTGRVE